LYSLGVARDRLEFVTPRPRPDYLQLFHRIDISLDTIPYNGHTTSLDSLWMGVPVVTLVGGTVVGRAGLSQLTNLQLPELIARTPQAYIALAVALAHDRDRLRLLRQTLRARMRQSPLMDAQRFARNIENAYRLMWLRWCNGVAPSPGP
jgi:protein O-GlcNAc transferase